jgi:hypothetical protein
MLVGGHPPWCNTLVNRCESCFVLFTGFTVPPSPNPSPANHSPCRPEGPRRPAEIGSDYVRAHESPPSKRYPTQGTASWAQMDSFSYVYISWTLHGMWMIYITFERGGSKFSNTTARALDYRDVRRFLNESLPQRWIGRVGKEDVALQFWPPRSPDLKPCEFFLWGFVKKQLCTISTTSFGRPKKKVSQLRWTQWRKPFFFGCGTNSATV